MPTPPEIYLTVAACNSTELSFAYQRTTGQGRSTLATSLAQRSLFYYSRFMIGSNQDFADSTN